MDDGFSVANFDKAGKYTGISDVIIPSENLTLFVIPFMLEGQFVSHPGGCHHVGHKSGRYQDAITSAVFKGGAADEDFEDIL